jgi:hypothetical protein
MPSYRSPSLRKMENGYSQRSSSGFSAGRIIGDPFALATISIGLVSECAVRPFNVLGGNANEADSLPGSSPSSALYYQPFMVTSQTSHGGLSCTCYFASSASLSPLPLTPSGLTMSQYVEVSHPADAPAYSPQITSFLAAGMVFTTSSVNSLVYSPVPAFEAAAAGYILLSMIAVCLTPRIHDFQCLRPNSDRLDLLLRIAAASSPPHIRRLVCVAQRAPGLSQLPPDVEQLRNPSRDFGRRQPGPANVHFRAAERL